MSLATMGRPAATSAATASGARASITQEAWGSTSDGKVDRYTLTDTAGMPVRINTYGGVVWNDDSTSRRGTRVGGGYTAARNDGGPTNDWSDRRSVSAAVSARRRARFRALGYFFGFFRVSTPGRHGSVS